MSPLEKLTDETRNGYPVKEGKQYAKSPVTGNYYVVTKWEDRGDGKMRAINKREIDEEELPEGVEFDV